MRRNPPLLDTFCSDNSLIELLYCSTFKGFDDKNQSLSPSLFAGPSSHPSNLCRGSCGFYLPVEAWRMPRRKVNSLVLPIIFIMYVNMHNPSPGSELQVEWREELMRDGDSFRTVNDDAEPRAIAAN